MKKCPYCGFANEEQADVCEHCKAALPHEEQKDKDTKRKRSE